MKKKNEKIVTTSTEDHLQQQAELLACKKLYSKAVRSGNNALEYWLEFVTGFAPIYEKVTEKKCEYLEEHFPHQTRTVRRALEMKGYETAIRDKIKTGEIVDLTAARRYVQNLKKEANKAEGKVKEPKAQPASGETVLKVITFVGTEKQYQAFLKWVDKHGVEVEEKTEDTPTNVTPLPEPQPPIDPDQQLAA